MKSILRIENNDDRFIQTVEWLVKCAEHPATRWEGLFELSPESDFMSYYNRSTSPPFQYLLTGDQKLRLKNALLSGQGNAFDNLGLVDLVYVGNEEEVYHYLINTLKNLPLQQLWIAEDYMIRVMHKKSNIEMEVLIKEFEEKRYDASDEELSPIVKKFIALAEK